MTIGKGGYFRALSEGDVLDDKPVSSLLERLNADLGLELVPKQLLRQGGGRYKITEYLSRLTLRIAMRPRGWAGLVVGFPGSPSQLTTETFGTPYLRTILYPMVDLYERIRHSYGDDAQSLYLLGVRFPDAVLRKFELLSSVVPRLVVLTPDLLCDTSQIPLEVPTKVNEQWVQVALRRRMMSTDGLRIPLAHKDIRLDYLRHELSAAEGTRKREQLDLLGVDRLGGSLVVLEIKGPDCSRLELENLFFQGLDHLEWLESHKWSVKFVFDELGDKSIDITKPMRLVLGFFGPDMPELYDELRRRVLSRHPGRQIDFVQFGWAGGEGKDLTISRPAGLTSTGRV
ncbi:MAG: hypothetical protein ACP5HS_14580 [Anaerolineae bacterium]